MEEGDERPAGGIAWKCYALPQEPASAAEEEAEGEAALQRALEAATALGARRQEEMRRHLETLCEAAGFTLEQVRGRGRQADVVEMRRILARFLSDRGLTLTQIGEHLDREHTSIHHLLSTPTPRPSRRRTVAA